MKLNNIKPPTPYGKHPLTKVIKEITDHGLESFGKWCSLYRAFVVDNKDPEGLQRLMLIIPDVSGMEAYDYWAFPRNVFSGSGYGSQVIPQIGDVVWVEFEGGNIEVPVWSLGHFAQQEKPTIIENPEDPNSYWFITPKGHILNLSDTKNFITIQNITGHAITLNSTGISLITKTKISLGSLNGSEQPAVLGNDLTDVLNDMQKFMKDLSEALSSDIVASAGGPYLTYANQSRKIGGLVQIARSLVNKIAKILSNKVTLDK